MIIRPTIARMWKFPFCSAFLLLLLLLSPSGGVQYDHTAYTECKPHPEGALYGGGILQRYSFSYECSLRRSDDQTNLKGRDCSEKINTDEGRSETGVGTPAFVLGNLEKETRYSFSCWIKIEGTDSALIKARLLTKSSTYWCIGSSLAKAGCWSFLKGGFVLDSPSDNSILYFQSSNNDPRAVISVASASLQPFTVEQWRINQEDVIRTKRKREVIIHASDGAGNRLVGANVLVEQVSKDFPFGSAINEHILGNAAYQAWFTERFNAAAFENELKWYATEPDPGQLNYTLADKLMEFVRSNQIVARGHNIFWENPDYNPAWVRNLTTAELASAVNSRIHSLMERYKGEFVHWDVNNEMLHYDFYEQRLGSNVSLQFFRTAQESDPLATLFMNEFNVVETCNDDNSTVDYYVERLRELARGGAVLEGIGLQGHFYTKPNVVLMRAVLDKLATLGMPIWLTELDINNKFDHQEQGIYLEDVLREAFSHPSVNGIVLWTALNPNGCYQMCLTDMNMRNLPAGDVVDKLLEEWETGEFSATTDEHGTCSFGAFLGEYSVSVTYGNRTTCSSFSLNRGDETRHLNIRL